MLQQPPHATVKSCKLKKMLLSHTFQGHRDGKVFRFLQFHLTSSQAFSHIFTLTFGWKQVLLFGMDSTSRPVKWRLCSIEHILCRDDLASCAYFRCHYTCSQYSDTLPFPTHCSTPMKQIVGLLEFLKPITANLSFVQTHDSFYSKINPIQAYASSILTKYCKHSILLPGSISRKYF